MLQSLDIKENDDFSLDFAKFRSLVANKMQLKFEDEDDKIQLKKQITNK